MHRHPLAPPLHIAARKEGIRPLRRDEPRLFGVFVDQRAREVPGIVVDLRFGETSFVHD
jgi:hypothetical protein